jgi:hypothetical protein
MIQDNAYTLFVPPIPCFFLFHSSHSIEHTHPTPHHIIHNSITRHYISQNSHYITLHEHTSPLLALLRPRRRLLMTLRVLRPATASVVDLPRRAGHAHGGVEWCEVVCVCVCARGKLAPTLGSSHTHVSKGYFISRNSVLITPYLTNTMRNAPACTVNASPMFKNEQKNWKEIPFMRDSDPSQASTASVRQRTKKFTFGSF